MQKMTKTSSLTLRLNAELKADIDQIASEMGINTSALIELYLRRVQRDRAIPFKIEAGAPAPAHLDAGRMDAEQLRAALKEGMDDVRNGHAYPAAEALSAIRRKHFE